MATLDDKLLGEKDQYYYSSSEDEGGSGGEDEDGSGSDDGRGKKAARCPTVEPPHEPEFAGGPATNVS